MKFEVGKSYLKGRTTVLTVENIYLNGSIIEGVINGVKITASSRDLQEFRPVDLKSYSYEFVLKVNVSNPDPIDITNYLNNKIELALREQGKITQRSEIIMEFYLVPNETKETI